jgi:hypothetical protein
MTIVGGIGIATGWQQVAGTPPVPLCFRYATIKSFQGTTPNFSGWTIDSLDFITNYISVFAADGCSTNVPPTNFSLLFDTHEIIVWYMGDGSSDPVWDIRNDLNDPVTITWDSICAKTCYEAVIPSTDTVMNNVDVMGPNFINFVYPNSTWGGGLDVSVPSSVAAAEAYYKQCCGTSTTITSTLVGTDYVVQIKDAYIFTAPIWSAFNNYYFNEISC